MHYFLFLKSKFYKSIIFVLLFSIHIISQAQTPVRDNNGYHLIDSDGEMYTKIAFDFIGDKYEGLFIAVKDGLWGYLNSNGKLEIACEYDVAYPFNGSFALVGKNGSYFHISRKNEKLDTLDWPKAPLVYRKTMLLKNENTNNVFFEDGSEILRSNNPLFCAPKSGIIEWKKDVDSVYQYISGYGRSRLIKTYNHGQVDSLIITPQGYLCLFKVNDGKKVYILIDERGRELVEMPAEGVHPNFIRVVWDDFVYWPNANTFHREVLYGNEIHYPMQDMSKLMQPRKTNYPFQLSEKYKDDEMVLIPNTYKWIQFNGRNVEGTRIFDDVRSGGKRYTAVKINREWYILDKREDTLGKTPYKHIHQVGMDDMRFFATTQNPSTGEEKWAFVNLKYNISTDEIFNIPMNNLEHMGAYSEPDIYIWHKRLNPVIKDGKLTYIDNRGNIIWTNPKSNAFTANDFFNLDFRFSRREFHVIPPKSNYKIKGLNLVASIDNTGIEVRLANSSKDVKHIQIQDGYFRAKLEYKNKKGEWETIAFLEPSWCGNSYYPIDFPSKKEASTHINLPKGNSEMLLRVKVQVDHNNVLISNEIIVKTNNARLWVKKYYPGFGSLIKPRI